MNRVHTCLLAALKAKLADGSRDFFSLPSATARARMEFYVPAILMKDGSPGPFKIEPGAFEMLRPWSERRMQDYIPCLDSPEGAAHLAKTMQLMGAPAVGGNDARKHAHKVAVWHVTMTATEFHSRVKHKRLERS